ncbi:hypothetical protein [Natrialbaceae archaeon AArc-T1-2]|uniref:hypothetical protein n=1 Tax=Natrialbaceae archaeon AArc-T1-2 TaxID=3053904 RepID=UPI00255A8A9E|nr:hypothetical protein [Natrialbaceae archaeon AArc-T1-2]WIV66046.1 hypothetical protein QQ977_10095 [Natrialbaceae archaeon AArc-T1-2]
MFVAVLPGDPSLFDVALALVMLVGMPLFVIAVLAVVAGYIRHDAEQYLEQLEADDLETADAEDTAYALEDEQVDEKRPENGSGDDR